jgi:hypothetical protein
MNEVFKDRTDEQLRYLKETLLYMLGTVEVELAQRAPSTSLRASPSTSLRHWS